MNQSDAQRMMAYDAQKKSLVVAYLLWWFLGYFGAHRFYLGHVGSGVVTLIFIGIFGVLIVGLWWLIDAFLIPGIVKRSNMRLAARIG